MKKDAYLNEISLAVPEHDIHLLAAAGEGAISAGRTEPHRDCSVAVSGGLGAYKMNKHSALRAGIFKALGSTDPMGVLQSAEARASALRSSSR
jgi:hypothetical protein